MKVELVVRFFFEHPYADHFIEHYLKLGFDHIYVLFQKNQPRMMIRNPKVSIIYHRYEGNEVYTHLTTLVHLKSEWVLFCDADEYLYLTKYASIQHFLKQVPPNVNQLLFHWAMVENFAYLKESQDLFDCLATHTLYSNPHVKSMVRSRTVGRDLTPHFSPTVEPCYLWNKHVKPSPTTGDYGIDNYVSMAYPFLLHFHTRSLQDCLIKSMVTSFAPKRANLNDLKKIISDKNVNGLKNVVFKIDLPFVHAIEPPIDMNIPLKGVKIDHTLVDYTLKFLCTKQGLDYLELIDFLKTVESTHGDHFRKNK